ncbi:MAG: lipopolysaccharide biosynthesis protein [Candidatus Electrothrix sp. Rat3]|nr:lipopolysaccharide biosynthesis protein [Candidatus Electrothrix rattekaaiensis]
MELTRFFQSAFTSLVNYGWEIIFRHPPSPEVIQQIKKFFIFGAGMLVAKIMAIAAQIIMGRKFGPEFYGEMTIILLLSGYFAMPIVNGWGLVFTKIAAREKDKKKKEQALKSLLFIVCICGILTILFLFVLQKPLSNLLDISPQSMKLTLLMTVFYAWWILTKQIAQGLQHWHTYVIIENTWAAIVLLGLLGIFFLQQTVDLIAVSTVFFLGYFLSGLFFLKQICQSFFVKIRLEYIKDILSHGWFLLLNGLVGVATFSIDRVFINRSLGAEEVGIYQAHFVSTYGIISAFMTIFLTYIFPIFCRNDNMLTILSKINRMQYPFTILISILIGNFVLRLYSYPVSFALFGSLCLFNAVQFHVQLKIWYLASRGASETKTTLQSQLIFLIVNLAVLIILIRYAGIVAGGISLLAGACACLAYLIQSEHTAYNERSV